MGAAMKPIVRTALATCLVVALAGPAWAGERATGVRLQIRNGRVSLEADNVPVRVILAEWAKVGRTRIENAAKIAGGPVSLVLKDVPERDALDILLRSVSGYIAAPRAVAVADASIYDRILVLATARPAATAAATPAAAQAQQQFRGRGGQSALPPGMGMGRGQPADASSDDESLAAGPTFRGMMLDQMQQIQIGPGGIQIATPGAGSIGGVMPSGAVNPALQGPASPNQPSTPAGAVAPGLPTGATSVPGVTAPSTPGTPVRIIKPPGSPLK